MPYAFKLPRKTGSGFELCITDGSEAFWERSSLVGETTIVTWDSEEIASGTGDDSE